MSASTKAAIFLALAASAPTAQASILSTPPPAFRTVAAEYGIPPSLLYAVALTESARIVDGRPLPWPWTLNVGGKGIRFETREAAEAALRRHLAAGEHPDVGLMQVNWRWHARLLRDPSLALDPWYNLRAGAAVLAREYEATGDWWRAVERYHSRDPERAARYRGRVTKWFGRIDQ